MDNSGSQKKLQNEIKKLEKEIEERLSTLPAHSFKPSIMQEIEELEERLKKKRGELMKLKSKK